MHSVLLVVEKPVGPTPQNTSWHDFGLATEGFGTTRPQNERLAENVWLIPLRENGLLDMNILVMKAAQYGLSSKAHFFEKDPEWCRATFER